MTRTLLAAAAAAIALAAPAFANDDVDTSLFSRAQLVELKAAQADDDHLRVAQIIAKAEAGGFGGADLSQIAASVDAEGYSNGDIVALKAAQDDDDSVRIFGLRNTGGDTTATVSTRSTASEQLARSVGVEPGTLSVSQIVRLKAAQADDDHFEIHRILSAVN